MNITPEQKERLKELVKALRSGEYKQTKESLRNEEGYCCLGVACDLYGKINNVSWGETLDFLYESTVLPLEVKEYFGFEHNFGFNYYLEGRGYKPLTWLNDNLFDFNQIADLIEKHYRLNE
jgi:hypothetical protein